jgi:hypothetical protein
VLAQVVAPVLDALHVLNIKGQLAAAFVSTIVGLARAIANPNSHITLGLLPVTSAMQNFRARLPCQSRPEIASVTISFSGGSPFGYRTIGIARKLPYRKEGTNLAFLGFFRRRRIQEFGIECGLSGFAELGDSKTREADALGEKSLHRSPARHRPDCRAMRGTWRVVFPLSPRYCVLSESRRSWRTTAS